MAAHDRPVPAGTALDLSGGGDKLRLRGRLPGAFGYDRAAHGLRVAQNQGVPAEALLPAAMPASWMVNNRTTSRVFQRWLSPPLRDGWLELIEALRGGPDAWLARDASGRDRVEGLVRELSIDGQSCCALSKVLALLIPETVPLMDDAAVALLTGLVPVPESATDPSAPPGCFVPFLDAFSQAVLDQEAGLIALAREHKEVPLDASQVLDRLIWFDSWGHRLFADAANGKAPL